MRLCRGLGRLIGAFALVAVVVLMARPAVAQRVSGPSVSEGKPGETIHFEGNLIGCYGGPGSETSFFGFPDRVVLYWNPLAMTDEEIEAFNDETTATLTIPPGMQEIASLTFNDSNHGWTLDATVPAGEVGQHAMVLGFEPQCQWKVLQADGTVAEDPKPSYRPMTFCVLDTDGECQHSAEALASVNEAVNETAGRDRGKGFDPADYAFVGGGLVFTVVGGSVVRRSGRRTQRTHAAPDPCHAQRRQLATASVKAHALQDALQTMRGMHQVLERQYEDRREGGYMSAVYDVASLAGSAWAKPAEALAGQWLKSQVFEGMMWSVTKTLGDSMAKDFLIYLNNAEVGDPSAWLTSLGEDQAKGEIQKRITEFLTTRQMQQYLREGLHVADGRNLKDILGVGERDYGGLRSVVSESYAPIGEAIGNLYGVAKLGNDVSGTMDDLEARRAELSRLHSFINNRQNMLDDELGALDVARHLFNLCANGNPGAP